VARVAKLSETNIPIASYPNRRAVRINPAIARRRAIASAVQRPCLRAFLFPLGVTGDGPPCIRPRGKAG
jgi:hypothetical protein